MLLLQQPDTLTASAVSAKRVVSPPTDATSGEKLQRSVNLADAIRDFSGIQLRDYGGVGGLKTVNVRSLGSAHTAIFLDGVPIDNAQNMQVDLGRIPTSGLESVELYEGQRSQLLQTAREYGSASSLHLTSALPSADRQFRLHLHGGAFGTIAPEASWEQGWGSRLRTRLLLSGNTANGRYPFHLRDWQYDTLMTRENGDVTAFRALAQMFYLREGGRYEASFNWYDSHRGIPGPIYKQIPGYPLSLDRQEDRSLTFQMGGEQVLSERLQVLLRAKYARDVLNYVDISEQDPSISATWNYLQQSVYASGALDFAVTDWLHLGGAVDGQLESLQGQVSARRKPFIQPFPPRF